MNKVLTIVGARPQFIKAAPVSKMIRRDCTEVVVHTGQHYDKNMSDIFYSDLLMEQPDYNLGVGSGQHGSQTAKILAGVEEIILKENPDWLLVYGDTNSTIAGALAAAKLHVPILHVEAGLRSYNRKMPEEVNRVVTDHLSSVLACPTRTAVTNLGKEGFQNIAFSGDLVAAELTQIPQYSSGYPLVINIGDVMYDALMAFMDIARNSQQALPGIDDGGDYILATVHRAENTDEKGNLAGILEGLTEAGKKVVLPLHPRTRKMIKTMGLEHFMKHPNLIAIEPVGYLDILRLIDRASKVVTDSGGMQKEAFMLGRPCVTLRDETEWTETVSAGWNVLAGLGGKRLKELLDFQPPAKDRPALYGDGRAAQRIATIVSS